MSNSTIKALHTLEKFKKLKQQHHQKSLKQDHCVVAFIKECWGEIFIYMIIFIPFILLSLIFKILGGGALIFFSILGLLTYVYIYKKNNKQIVRKNQQDWLLQAPRTRFFIELVEDFELMRVPLLVYGIYMVEQLSLHELDQACMHLAERILEQNTHENLMDPEIKGMLEYAKNEYAFGLNQVADVFYILCSVTHLNQKIIEDLIQKLFQSFANERSGFIQDEDDHLHQVLKTFRHVSC